MTHPVWAMSEKPPSVVSTQQRSAELPGVQSLLTSKEQNKLLLLTMDSCFPANNRDPGSLDSCTHGLPNALPPRYAGKDPLICSLINEIHYESSHYHQMENQYEMCSLFIFSSLMFSTSSHPCFIPLHVYPFLVILLCLHV